MLITPRNVALLGGQSGPTYSAEATALFARMSVQPDATRMGLSDACITSLMSNGVWTKLECLWMPAAHDSQAGRLNWVSSGNTISAVGSPTFTTDRGYTTNGSTSYLDTNFNPSTASVYALNGASVGCWCRTESAANSSLVEMGALIATNRAVVQGRVSGGLIAVSVNQTATNSAIG